jgi:3',5'-nucleoside bisphosphate phosphatase
MASFPPYPVDLHCHTTRSDGNDLPVELIENAADQGLLALSITDHDIQPPAQLVLSGGHSISTSEYASEFGMILVPGYEFSTNTGVEDVHIYGYVFDWLHPELQPDIRKESKSCVRSVSAD